MSRRVSKLLALYAGLRSSEGAPISLKDLKRRCDTLSAEHRTKVFEAMTQYIEERSPENRGELRAARPGWGKEAGAGGGGILKFIAGMLGLAR